MMRSGTSAIRSYRHSVDLDEPGGDAIWVAILLTGLGAGFAAGVLTLPLQSIEHLVWPSPNILDAAAKNRASHGRRSCRATTSREACA